MRSPAVDLKEIILNKYTANNPFNIGLAPSIFHIGFDLSSVTEFSEIPDGILLLDIQAEAPEPFTGHSTYQRPVVQIFYNFKQKKQGEHDYDRSYRASELVHSLIHGFNSWSPVNGAVYLSILETTSSGFLDVSQALSFPLLSTSYQCQRKPLYLGDYLPNGVNEDIVDDYSYSWFKNDEETERALMPVNGKITIPYSSGDTIRYKSTHSDGYCYESIYTAT